MTQDEIIEMARQAGFIFLDGLGDDGECRKYGEAWPEQIEAFAKLVAAKEREACAQIGDYFHDDEANCGDLIRARGESK